MTIKHSDKSPICHFENIDLLTSMFFMSDVAPQSTAQFSDMRLEFISFRLILAEMFSILRKAC